MTKLEVKNTGNVKDLMKQILDGIQQSAGTEIASLVEQAFQTKENQEKLQIMQDRLDNPPDAD